MNYDDEKLALEWREKVLMLFQKLPQYNKKDFDFEICVGGADSARREKHYFVEYGKYHNYFYDWREVIKRSTENLEEAIYWILHDRISNYAIKYEVNHRIRYESSRRQWFKLEQDMFDIIGEPYSDIKRKEQAKTLLQTPFNDVNACKMDLVDEYQKVENWIQTSEYKDMLKNLPNMTKLLVLWRAKKGISNFDELFNIARNEMLHFYNFLVESTEPDDEPYPTEFFEIVEHFEKIAKEYL